MRAPSTRPTIHASWTLEVLWLLIAAAVAAAAVLPPLVSAGPYAQYIIHAALTFAAVWLGRIALDSARVPWLKPRIARAVFLIALVPVALLTVLAVNELQTFLDADGPTALFGEASGLQDPRLAGWSAYVRSTYLLAAVATVVACVALPPILLVRLWREIKVSGTGRSPIARSSGVSRP